MRPLWLSLTAFGAYAGVQVIDFSELKNRTFFLIHGPTGSGKTTILDGMCFALYGETSGTREGKAMRSDHAKPDVMTEVVFEFALGSTSYRVKRIPEQQRPKKRGEGITTKLAEAELWHLKSEPELISAGWSDVSKKIEELIGFKSSQFRQVVLLPQGDFRKLLTANSTERQEIMQTLFKTELYRKIEDKLKEKASTLKREFEEFNKQRQWVLEQATVNSSEELSLQLKEHKTVLVNFSTEVENVAISVKNAQNAVNEGLLIQEKIAEKAAAELVITELTAQTVQIEISRQELQRLVRAAALFDAEKMLLQYEQDVLSLKAEYEKQSKDMLAAHANQLAAEKIYVSESAKELERTECAKKLVRLEQMQDKVKALNDAVTELDKQKTIVQQSLLHKDKFKAKEQKLVSDYEHKLKEYEQLKALAAESTKWSLELTSIQNIIAKRKQLEAVQSELITLDNDIVSFTENLARLEKGYSEEKQFLLNMQQLWADGQAAIMAANLTAGTPCPVCGSHEHPKLAVSTQHLPNESQIKKQQLKVEKLEKQIDSYKQQGIELQTQRNTIFNRINDIKSELADSTEISIDGLNEQFNTIQAAYEKCKAAEEAVIKLSKQLEELAREKTDLAELCEQAENAWCQAENALKATEAIVNERRQVVPIELQDIKILLKAIADTGEKNKQLKANLENARTMAEKAQQLVIKCQTNLESTQNNLKSANIRFDNEQKLFNERLNLAGFEKQAAYENAKRPPSYIVELEQRINNFDKEFNSAKLRLEHAQKMSEGLIIPDMDSLNQQLELLGQQYNELLTKQAQLASTVKAEEAWGLQVNKLDKALEKLEQQYSILGQLSEVANGGNEHRLTFGRFVLGALLEDVAVAANERLKMMSRGRYYLQRTMDRSRKNAAGGLELEVFDNYTGVSRGVATLSGGETFLASLSLALGLADVVQAYAGGIHLDTILVDEGFGTLDPESLDCAIKALLDLQRGGRLVGIISHVPELKERIDARLEVSITDHGSTAAFKIG